MPDWLLRCRRCSPPQHMSGTLWLQKCARSCALHLVDCLTALPGREPRALSAQLVAVWQQGHCCGDQQPRGSGIHDDIADGRAALPLSCVGAAGAGTSCQVSAADRLLKHAQLLSRLEWQHQSVAGLVSLGPCFAPTLHASCYLQVRPLCAVCRPGACGPLRVHPHSHNAVGAAAGRRAAQRDGGAARRPHWLPGPGPGHRAANGPQVRLVWYARAESSCALLLIPAGIASHAAAGFRWCRC